MSTTPRKNNPEKSQGNTHENIVGALQEILDDAPTLLKRSVRLPAPVKDINPVIIRKIRQRLGYTQNQFAIYLNVPTITARYWETGKREPSGAALRLLDVARNNPEALFSTSH